jgi:hypothetical protein
MLSSLAAYSSAGGPIAAQSLKLRKEIFCARADCGANKLAHTNTATAAPKNERMFCVRCHRLIPFMKCISRDFNRLAQASGPFPPFRGQTTDILGGSATRNQGNGHSQLTRATIVGRRITVHRSRVEVLLRTVSYVYRDTRFTVGILPGFSSRNWGLMRASCQRTPKNRCGPVERPVDPTRPSV